MQPLQIENQDKELSTECKAISDTVIFPQFWLRESQMNLLQSLQFFEFLLIIFCIIIMKIYFNGNHILKNEFYDVLMS